MLLFVKIGEVSLNLGNVGHVTEHLVGIGKVLVDIVKVGQHQLAPTVEMVYRLLRLGTLHIGLVKVAHKLYGVCHGQQRVAAEEVADGHVSRSPHGLSSRHLKEMTVQKQRGTLVWEHHGHARHVFIESAEQVGGDKLKECFAHIFFLLLSFFLLLFSFSFSFSFLFFSSSVLSSSFFSFLLLLSSSSSLSASVRWFLSPWNPS